MSLQQISSRIKQIQHYLNEKSATLEEVSKLLDETINELLEDRDNIYNTLAELKMISYTDPIILTYNFNGLLSAVLRRKGFDFINITSDLIAVPIRNVHDFKSFFSAFQKFSRQQNSSGNGSDW